MNKKSIFIAGAAGFVGSHLVRTLAAKGHTLRLLVRDENKAKRALKNIDASNITFIVGDITDAGTLKGALEGMDVLVHLVGIIEERARATYKDIHIRGTENLVNEALRFSTGWFFYQSALGADDDSFSEYLKSKARAETIVRQSGLAHNIFRPSLIVGKGDGFTQRMMKLIRGGPVVVLPSGGSTLFQPIYIEDWIRCFEAVFDKPKMYPQTIEIGGPEHLSYKEITRIYMKEAAIKKPMINIPVSVISAGGPVARGINRLFGADIPVATNEQLRLLSIDNITDTSIVKTQFGFSPITLKQAAKDIIEPPLKEIRTPEA